MSLARQSWTAVAITLLLVLVMSACGGAKKASETANTPATPGAPQATSTLPPATATAVAQLIATAAAGLGSVPVISQALAPGWQEEGEAGAKLTDACPSDVQRRPFANSASHLLRRTSGEQARSAAVIYLDISEGRTYAQQLFGSATCAQALVSAWFGQTVQFGPATSGTGIGGESVSVQNVSGATSATVVFLRREEGVAAVAVLGAESAQLASQLATVQDGAITEKLQSLQPVTPAP